MTEKLAPQEEAAQQVERIEKRSRILVWSSLVFALLQSICTALVALSGVRTLIGAAALTLSSTNVLLRFHQSPIRLPMLVLSVIGALIDLGVLWQVRRLRSRPSSQWRQKPVSPGRRRAETAQLILSVLTLLLVGAEMIAHKHLHGVFVG